MIKILTIALVVAASSANERFERAQADLDAGRFSAVEAAIAEGFDEIDPGLVARLRGVLALALGEPRAAITHLERANELLGGERTTALYLARAYIETNRFRGAVELLDRFGGEGEALLAVPLLRARALSGEGQPGAAYEVLVDAVDAFSEEPALYLEIAALCTDLKLHHVARTWLAELGELDEVDRGTIMAAIDLVYREPRHLDFVESLAARFRDDPEVRAHLAYAYAATGNNFAAARLFDDSTLAGGNYRFQAADQYRLARHYRRALQLNGQLETTEQHLEQRAAILFASGRMNRVVALEELQLRAGSLSPRAHYRVAYAHYAIGNEVEASRRARALLDGPMAASAEALLAAMGRAR